MTEAGSEEVRSPSTPRLNNRNKTHKCSRRRQALQPASLLQCTKNGKGWIIDRNFHETHWVIREGQGRTYNKVMQWNAAESGRMKRNITDHLCHNSPPERVLCLHFEQSRQFRGDLDLRRGKGPWTNVKLPVNQSDRPRLETRHDQSKSQPRTPHFFSHKTLFVFFKLGLFFTDSAFLASTAQRPAVFAFFHQSEVSVKHAYDTAFKSLYCALLWEMSIRLLSK